VLPHPAGRFLALILFSWMTANALADPTGQSDSLARAYAILHGKGILIPPPQPAATVVVKEPSRHTAAPVTVARTAAITEEPVVPHAYQVLRSLGLLSVDQPTSVAPARAHRTLDRIVVDKSKRRLYLVKNGKRIREFKVWLGREPKGPKREAGDKRTPEGVYTLDWRNPRSRYYKSIHISYPNAADLEHANARGVDPGGMIMIHGEHYNPAFRALYRRARKADWTEGCIALRNDEMDELWQHVADGTTIEIVP
jgi:lipoprotein-anchoring transpeptidase ErfK/SrfK